MKNALYILNYHEISWENNSINFGIGPPFSPDIFYNHLEVLNDHFELLSVNAGIQKLKSGQINNPSLCIWFDDGTIGVRKYAFDILENFKIKGAISVNSNFFLKKEMFWRYKLSYILSTDSFKVLRSRLKKYGYNLKDDIKDFTINNFSIDILKAIDLTYRECSPDFFRKDAFRLFDNIDGIRFLLNNSWTIANHSASHYPITEDSAISMMQKEFNDCDVQIKKHLEVSTPYWVAPFDRHNKRAENLFNYFKSINDGTKYLVMVGDQLNFQIKKNIIYRISLPKVSGLELVRCLKRL